MTSTLSRHQHVLPSGTGPDRARDDCAPHAPDGATAARFGFLLVPNFSMIAFVSAVEALRIANRLSERELFRWEVLSPNGAAVVGSNGIKIAVDGMMTSLSGAAHGKLPYDIIFVCGGIGSEHFRDDGTFNWLRRFEAAGGGIGALCVGSHIIARAGLLHGYRCVIHWENLPGFREHFPDIDVSTDLFEVDRNRYTCSGGTAALDLMLHVVALRHGGQLSTKVSEQLMVDRVRRGDDQQRLPLHSQLGIHHPKLINAIELMAANIEEPLTQQMLADYVGLSRRQLERLFRRQIGRAPAHYYLELRLERARQLLYQTDMRIIDLALACGFVSASHFSKCYRQMYGKTPREERVLATMANPALG
jgi:transcriptional regulator GlxA family with amidase domain